MRFQKASLFGTALLLMTIASPTQAANAFIAVVRSQGGAIDSDDGSVFATASGSYGPDGNNVSGHGNAFAGFGRVNAIAEAMVYGIPGSHTNLEMRSIVDAAYFDLNITALSGIDTNTLIHTMVHFHIDGSMDAYSAPGGGAQASASINILINGHENFGAVSFDGTDVNSFDSNGLFLGLPRTQLERGLDFAVECDLYVAPNNLIYMGIDVRANADQNGAQPGLAAHAIGLYGHTLSFASGRPVIDLPEGWTVNSVGANIVDNRWVDNSVPEPSTLVLGIAVVVGLSSVTLRKKFRRA
jgi:hypothetical protein